MRKSDRSQSSDSSCWLLAHPQLMAGGSAAMYSAQADALPYMHKYNMHLFKHGRRQRSNVQRPGGCLALHAQVQHACVQTWQAAAQQCTAPKPKPYPTCSTCMCLNIAGGSTAKQCRQAVALPFVHSLVAESRHHVACLQWHNQHA